MVVRAATVETGGITHKEYTGELRFHPGFGVKKPVAIPDEAIGYRKIWREIGELARSLDRPLHLKDVMQLVGTKDPSRASHNVKRAMLAGLVKKLPHRGWLPV